MRIALTLIVSDDREYDSFKRMLEVFLPHVDGVYCSINGLKSSKRIQSLLKKHGCVYEVVNEGSAPELYEDGQFSNFAEARNRSLRLVDKEYDWITWADSDDIIAKGEDLRVIAKQADEMGVDTVHFTYWYAVKLGKDKNGDMVVDEVIIDHVKERLFKPGKFKWISRLHEVIVPIDGHYKPKHTEYDYNPKEGRETVWIHLAPFEKSERSMKRNERILEIQAKEEEHKDPRTLFYLAKVYFDQNNKEKNALAIELLKEYLNMSGWEEERANAREYLALSLERQGNLKEALENMHEALREDPENTLFYLRISDYYYKLGHLRKGDAWLDTALKMKEHRASTTIGNPYQIKVLASTLKYNRAVREQNLDDMLEWAKIRNELLDTPETNQAYEDLLEIEQRNEIAKHVFSYAKWLKDTGNRDNVNYLLESLPIELGREPFAAFIANQVKKPKKWGKKSIVYYASGGGESFEDKGWSPKSLDEGVGGSETAVIELSKRWSKAGYEVTVYGDPREQAGEHDGVMYRPWYEINWSDYFNILILWRSPHLVERVEHANTLYMDLHDIADNLSYTPEIVNKLDKVFVKSEYHRKMIPNVPNEKVEVISNGI